MKKSSDSPQLPQDVPRRVAGAAGAAETVGPDALSSILDLDEGATLARIRAGRRAAWQLEAEQMVAATHWADLHRLPAPSPDDPAPVFGSVHDETTRLLGAGVNGTEGMTWGTTPSAHDGGDGAARGASEAGPGQPGIEGVLRFLGEGAYLVREFAVTALAATLEMGEASARTYLGQALECRDRLPLLWQQVLAGAVPAWKARQIAQLTLPLNASAARFVDLSLHHVAGRIGIVRITRAVEAAIIRYDPDLAAAQAQSAAERRGVWVGPARGPIEDTERRHGLTRIDAVVDSPDAKAFALAVADIAGALGALGDDDPLPVRRARAIGILADPQHALDVAAAAQVDPAVDPETGLVRRRPRRRGPVARRSLVVDLHLHLTPGRPAGTGTPTAPPVGPVVRDGELGPVSRAAVERWLAQLAPDAPVRVRPVVDLADDTAVDAHEVPRVVADIVDERDVVCQFPWCGRPAGPGTTDRDHIEPYVPPDEGGPPGQTSARRLARLCRYHHRVKTHGGWHYRRLADGALSWISPHGQAYRVDPRGTSRLEIPGPEPDPD